MVLGGRSLVTTPHQIGRAQSRAFASTGDRARGHRGALTDVDAVIVPVAAGHVLIDVRVDPSHLVRQAASHVGDGEVEDDGVGVVVEGGGGWRAAAIGSRTREHGRRARSLAPSDSRWEEARGEYLAGDARCWMGVTRLEVAGWAAHDGAG